MAITSEELQKEITLKVHDRLDADLFQQEGEKNLRDCPECRDAYERELEQKMVVRERFGGERSKTVPDAIKKSIEAITQAENRRRAFYSRRSRRSGAGLPLLMLLLIILGLGAYIILFDNPSETEKRVEAGAADKRESIPESTRRSTGPINMFNQAILTYENLMSGKLQVEYEEDQFSDLLSTFAEQGIPRLTFPGVALPLKGGIVSKRGETSLPYLIYEQGDTKLYISEIPLSVLKEGKGFYVTEDVLAQLEAEERIWMETQPRGNLVMYKEGEGDAVIVAVANRSHIDMSNLLNLR